MLTALIVIYNKYCCDSNSFKFIENYKNKLDFVLFDNSTKDYNNKEYCELNGITYYTLNENVGLSKAYNYVIDRIELSENNYLLLLDDDTLLNEEYINEIISKIEKENFDVLLPKVYSKEQLISPSVIQFNCRVKKIVETSNIDLNRITAINSGMVVNTSVYKKIRYNEKIFLDYVDHEFMRSIRANQCKVEIMNSRINQNFSRNEKVSIVSAKFRFNIYKKDFKTYCNICRNNWFYYINIIKLKIINFIKYKKNI